MAARDLGVGGMAGRMGLEFLTAARIKGACTARSYSRGAKLHKSGRVASARLLGCTVKAAVKDDGEQKVEASWEADGRGRRSLSHACTCPYSYGGRACAHVTAVLLHAMDNTEEMDRRAGMGALRPARLVDLADERYMRRFLARELAGNSEAAERFALGLGTLPPAGMDYYKRVRAMFAEAAAAEALEPFGYSDNYVELGGVMETAAEFEKAGELAEAARIYGQIASSADHYMNMAYPYGDYVTVADEAKKRRRACLARAGPAHGRHARK